MSSPLLPLIVEPELLERHLGEARLFLVDLCQRDAYLQSHIPGAVHLGYAQIVRAQPPMLGLLPDNASLEQLFSAIGLRRDHHVVAYDEEGGSRAARLLWTLDVIGHPAFSLLNGGLTAWQDEQRPLTDIIAPRPPSDYRIDRADRPLATKDYVLAHLHDPGVVLLDTRSPGEFRGVDKRAARAGHIPGAVNLDWIRAMDVTRGLRFKPAEELRAAFTAVGVTPDKEIVVYCQTHHRSAHTYMVLKMLGYPRVRAYPGSWSEWGNDPDTPIE
ncbi:MAG: thiosulfate sulfurtransferase [Candidatus Muproteobacteria bacterium RBG_16_64_11]|uniref:Sulfurtransferase n=1 Tax=Candidatus Muproteobacteria bacterium RBG_16_64_11 TaxID=1817758 RepID=A0A1F6TC79_9PROT|nr:MAG: thiosulfate sulfurtransferase [Candidatus Muproteobacteria bacterium RBG_16_64_11]